MGMKGSGPVPRLTNRNFLFIFLARLQNIGRRPPIPLGNLCEIPGMTFSARKATTRLVDGEVILRTGEMNGGDQPDETVICLFEGGFARKRLPLIDLDKTVSLRITLFD
jgi:hypothetical protein